VFGDSGEMELKLDRLGLIKNDFKSCPKMVGVINTMLNTVLTPCTTVQLNARL